MFVMLSLLLLSVIALYTDDAEANRRRASSRNSAGYPSSLLVTPDAGLHPDAPADDASQPDADEEGFLSGEAAGFQAIGF